MLSDIAWPAVALALGLAFMLLFRGAIKSLLGRTKRLSTGGLEAFESPQPRAPEKPDALAKFMGTFDNPLLREQEAVIQADLSNLGLVEPETANLALVRTLAGTQILLAFERLQTLIWASQIDALSYLNSRPDGAPLPDLETFYANARQQWPQVYQDYSFQEWIAFLISFHAVERIDNRTQITKIGREFLKWRVESGRSGPFHG